MCLRVDGRALVSSFMADHLFPFSCGLVGGLGVLSPPPVLCWFLPLAPSLIWWQARTHLLLLDPGAQEGPCPPGCCCICPLSAATEILPAGRHVAPGWCLSCQERVEWRQAGQCCSLVSRVCQHALACCACPGPQNSSCAGFWAARHGHLISAVLKLQSSSLHLPSILK